MVDNIKMTPTLVKFYDSDREAGASDRLDSFTIYPPSQTGEVRIGLCLKPTPSMTAAGLRRLAYTLIDIADMADKIDPTHR